MEQYYLSPSETDVGPPELYNRDFLLDTSRASGLSTEDAYNFYHKPDGCSIDDLFSLHRLVYDIRQRQLSTLDPSSFLCQQISYGYGQHMVPDKIQYCNPWEDSSNSSIVGNYGENPAADLDLSDPALLEKHRRWPNVLSPSSTNSYDDDRMPHMDNKASILRMNCIGENPYMGPPFFLISNYTSTATISPQQYSDIDSAVDVRSVRYNSYGNSPVQIHGLAKDVSTIESVSARAKPCEYRSRRLINKQVAVAKTFVCEGCNEKFRSQVKLRTHQKEHGHASSPEQRISSSAARLEGKKPEFTSTPVDLRISSGSPVIVKSILQYDTAMAQTPASNYINDFMEIPGSPHNTDVSIDSNYWHDEFAEGGSSDEIFRGAPKVDYTSAWLEDTFAYCQPYNDIDGRSIENVMNVSTAEPDQVRGIFHEKMARDTDAFSDRNNDTGLVSAPAESLIDKSVKATITSSVSTRIAPYTLSEAKPMEQNAPSTNKPPINIKPDPHTPYETPITVRKRSEEISPDDWLSLGPSSVFNGNSKHSQVFLKEVLPWAFSNFDNIMGNENIGTIELHMLGREREPTIWIVAGDITKVDRDFLELGLSRFGVSFATKIDKGGPKRSGNNRTQGIPWPPANGQFQQRPTCGASIGVGDNTASFGGLIQLRTTSGWTTFGITCHHFLEERARETTCAGVVNGLLGKRSYEVLQPSKHHITYDLKCMKYGYSNLSPVDESSLSEDEKQYRNVRMEKMSKNIARLEKICESRESYFGKVKFSSGYDRTSHAYPPSLFDNCTDDTLVHTMDWAIFDDIPGQRLPQENRVVGRPSNSYAEENEPVSTMVCSQFFEDVFNRSACPDAQPVANVSIPEPHRRVQGVGAITGHQDGYLATTPGLIKLEEYGKHTLEWSFCPRYKNGLGQAGDSGAWIFDDYGSVIGMILAHSDISELTYFTPIKVLFDDILEVTGATEIRVAPPLHTKGREFNNQRDPARQPTSWSPSILTPETLIETPSPGRKRKNVDMDVDMDVDSDGCEAKRPKHQNASAIKEHL